MPTKYHLDKISTEIPIVFVRICGHMATANTKALELLKIDENTTMDGEVIELGRDGKPEGGFYPNEKMDIQDAIDCYTYGSAFNEFKEDFKGRLKPGYLADLIVLDRDIFTINPEEIKDIVVERTMIDGSFIEI